MSASTYMEFHVTTVTPEEVFLCQGNSTSATGWVRKSNFDKETQPIQLEISRALAMLCLENDVGLYSQWFAGEDNVVTDSLTICLTLS